MINRPKRRALCIGLIVLNVLFIWGNSMLPRELSSAFSKWVSGIIHFIFPGPDVLSSGEGHGFLRKVAHFTEFSALGILLSWHTRMVRKESWKYVVYPAVSGIVVAIVDETIQAFVPGRGPGVLDVCIDSAGVLLGMGILAWVLVHRKQKHKAV